MAQLSELSPAVRLFLKFYPWKRLKSVPWALFSKPLANARIALISSAGLVLSGQPPFDHSIRGGDCSFREIPSDANVRNFVDAHKSHSFDHTAMHEDPNLVFPIDRLREFETEARIGSVNDRHLSFMGSITKPRDLIRDTAPEAARLLREDKVDAALLVPV